MQQDADLTGTVAIITGGGRGIGRSIAQELAVAGMTVAVVSRTAAQIEETVAEIEVMGGHALGFAVDVTDQQAVEQMVEDIVARYKRIDLLVNNAGVATPFGTAWDVDPDEWWRTIDINLRGAFLCARSVSPVMIEQQSGRIVNLVSGASINPRAYFSAYGISKTALQRFTESLAIEVAEYGMQVFGVDPGWVRTEMTEHLLVSPLIREKYPLHRKIYEDGIDHQPDLTAKILHTIASGKADALSGRFISVLLEDINTMIKHAAQIEQDSLYVLSLNRLPK